MWCNLGGGGASGAIARLAAEGGKVTRPERPAFDGFSLFQFVAPGKYTVRVGPAQFTALDLLSADDPEVEITGDGTIAGEQRIVLLPGGI